MASPLRSIRDFFLGPVAAAAKPKGDPPDPERSQRWVSATKEAREALKWVVTAIAGAAAVVFGAGPILTAAKIDVAAWDWWRYVFFFLGAALGIVGVVIVIFALLRAMLPTELTLRELPKELVADLDQNAGATLPGTARSVADFQERLIAYRRAPAKLEALASDEQDEVTKGKLLAAAENARQSYANYRAGESEILDQAAFRLTRDRITGVFWPIIGGGLLAAIGAGTYLIATSAVPDPPSLTASPSVLIRAEGSAAQSFWTQLGLARCEIGTAGRIPVLVTSGDGSTTNPYQVTTWGGDGGCPALSFSVDPRLGVVELPKPRKVTVEFQQAPGEGR